MNEGMNGVYLISSEEAFNNPRTGVNRRPNEIGSFVGHGFIWIQAEVLWGNRRN